MIQNSPEWYDARRGKVTSSCLHFVLAKGKGKLEAKTRENYRFILAKERISGTTQETYSSPAMKRGQRLESEALAWYEGMSGNTIIPTFFVDHPTIPMFGASCDGRLSNNINIELKCMSAANHWDFFIEGEPSTQHKKQMTGEMMCLQSELSHYLAYSDEVADPLRMKWVEYELDQEMVDLVTMEVMRFNGEVATLVNTMLETIEELK